MTHALELHVRVAGVHASRLRALLFPGDGREAVAVALCGRHLSDRAEILTIHDVIAVPDDQYVERGEDRVTWTTDFLAPILERADREGLSVLKVHSHPSGYAAFSATDDRADSALFESVYGWVENADLHGSAIALPDGSFIARAVRPDGSFARVDRVLIAGENIEVFDQSDDRVPDDVPAEFSRHALALGPATTHLIQRLRVGVVGCSGTGSFVVEELLRLGVGELVAVDPECVEVANLNRILNATLADATNHLPKVALVERTARLMGLGTKVTPVQAGVADPAAVMALAGCDVVFGCVDSHDGRRTLNRIATFYLVPYIDVGVLIEVADESITHISGAVHYLQPGRSSLLSRGVIDNERATEEALERHLPDVARARRREGYLRGAPQVTRPAVIAVNGLFASKAVFELLARLHGFRLDDHELAEQRICLTDAYQSHQGETPPCEGLRRYVGRADIVPLLDMPELSPVR